MKLTLDQNNAIIGVDEDNSTYDYVGTVPDDLSQHTSDGYYMISTNTIELTPVINTDKATSAPSATTQQISNLISMIAATQKGNEG